MWFCLKIFGFQPIRIGSSGTCLDGRENHGSGQGKLLHKGAYSQLTTGLPLSAQRIQNFVPQLVLAWQNQGREAMLMDVHSSKFRKNLHTFVPLWFSLPRHFNPCLGWIFSHEKMSTAHSEKYNSSLKHDATFSISGKLAHASAEPSRDSRKDL